MITFEGSDTAGYKYYKLTCDACEKTYKFGVYMPMVMESFILDPTPGHKVISGIGHNEIYSRILYINGEVYDLCYNCLHAIGNVKEKIIYPFEKFIEKVSSELFDKTIFDIREKIIENRKIIKESKRQIRQLSKAIKVINKSDIISKFCDIKRNFNSNILDCSLERMRNMYDDS